MRSEVSKNGQKYPEFSTNNSKSKTGVENSAENATTTTSTEPSNMKSGRTKNKRSSWRCSSRLATDGPRFPAQSLGGKSNDKQIIELREEPVLFYLAPRIAED